ncbi:MAG: hypothetical protein Altm2KO_03050 [Alteromonas macleodii]|jgi:hypothetical protein|tara:strand:- start:639 stop:1436 length:798 start_codon:yes stop_codon:yes gene_type:complete
MAIKNFEGADGTYSGGQAVTIGNWIIDGGILRLTGTAPTGDGRILWESANEGTFSVDLERTLSSGSYAGIVFRASDANNCWALINRGQDNRLRLIKVVDGSATNLFDEYPSGVSANDVRSLSVTVDSNSNTIKCYQNGTQIGGDIVDDYNATATLAGLRVGSSDWWFDDFSFPEPVSAASKTVTFNLHQDLVGVPGVNFLISPAPLGDSIASGTLDTSENTVTFNLDAFTDLNDGETLILIATDKTAANDDNDIISWDSSTVAVV